MRSCSPGGLSLLDFVMSRYDGTKHNINKRMDCSTSNVVYYILCGCVNEADYVGSTKRCLSKHKHDIRNSNWTACGLTSHFGRHHRGNMEEAVRNLKVTLTISLDLLFSFRSSNMYITVLILYIDISLLLFPEEG
jgi:hypothetical protein